MALSASEAQKFSEELSWCITQLELGLMRQSPDSKQVAETVKVLKILKSSKAPMVKKRQAMRNALGDYRKKMKDAENKALSGLRHSKFKSIDSQKSSRNSKYLKQSHSKQLHLVSNQLTNLNLTNSQPNTTGQSIESHDLDSQPSSSYSSEKKYTFFKYVPSDNSFCFGFDPDGGDQPSEEMSEAQQKEKSEPTDNLSSKDSVYKFEKSFNDFTFNFDATECGS
ncbi:UPF0488 protein [Biomphalaria glabrata]|uniref:UPF0488 protein C8orf33 homolog n=1 Tax=Biomphalaria glabrata TaxID=6526 RepID=A0A9W2YPS9_BIOGL|nr:UPF0488 protein C8orf33 homolog [Biomphalaria glabrata]XP_013085662.2 UPF0488 protein C8orf33 homolog [Biomphalaria glabrata]XP_055864796.1 UPF0488 protein C8orf33 homolog [Biomphalaria glabrata]XP_055864797.1 UPF0488 protein C8orf33 homolog [Biomphalaria glabrata]KAI8736440.1 putative UPF0488 protein C8orf33 [Biomphalaria glabrata]